VAFDPFLYVALGVGVAAGRIVRWRSPWVGRATRFTIVVLVGLLGTLLDGVPFASLLISVPVALALAISLLGTTAIVYLFLARWKAGSSPSTGPVGTRERVPFGIVLVATLVAGFALGHFVALPSSQGITWALYALLALVGFDLKLHWIGLRQLAPPLTSAVAAATGCAIAFALASGTPWSVSFATTFAFGWYTLAGPLVAARAGTLLGILAFLTNFFRENLTMVVSPYLGRRLRGPGLAALGGATSMDTTLYFVTRYGDADAGTLSLASGLVLTLAAGLLLPVLLALPL
jgi:uncharacterized membrane protein YbjE (DUF340 family)